MNRATEALVEPERQFVGCLMCLPLNSARRLLAGMRAHDLADPQAAQVLALAIELVGAGQPPAPVTLYAHAVATGRAAGETRRSWLGTWLADTYTATQLPALGPHLKAVVLEAAWRRAIAAHGRRLVHAAEHSPTDVLADLADDAGRIADLWDRYQRARDDRPTTLEVAA